MLIGDEIIAMVKWAILGRIEVRMSHATVAIRSPLYRPKTVVSQGVTTILPGVTAAHSSLGVLL